ncbi:MAG: hypothetical protein V9G13_10230 [Marmoricola sp.]
MFHCNGWGMPFAMAGLGVKQVVLRKVDGHEILRRIDEHGVTLLCGAPAVVAAILDAAKAWEGEVPGRRSSTDGGCWGTAAQQDDCPDRDRAWLGVHPDLRLDRDVALAHGQPLAC